jgi:hypothetical protein
MQKLGPASVARRTRDIHGVPLPWRELARTCREFGISRNSLKKRIAEGFFFVRDGKLVPEAGHVED